MSSELLGVAELAKKLSNLTERVRGNAMRAVVRAGIKPARERWKATIAVGSKPHRTYKGLLVGPGFAQRSIRVVTRLSADKQQCSAALGVRSQAYYATWFIEQEIGKSKKAAHPTLRPAFESTRSQQEAALAAKLLEIINKVAAGQPE